MADLPVDWETGYKPMPDTRHSCPACRAETLSASAGRTGIDRATWLCRRLIEVLPDREVGLISIGRDFLAVLEDHRGRTPENEREIGELYQELGEAAPQIHPERDP